jgi:hypothetical protein
MGGAFGYLRVEEEKNDKYTQRKRKTEQGHRTQCMMGSQLDKSIFLRGTSSETKMAAFDDIKVDPGDGNGQCHLLSLRIHRSCRCFLLNTTDGRGGDVITNRNEIVAMP